MSTIFQRSGESSLLPLRPGNSALQQDPLVYIDRQTKYIQHNLQVLIDAQSDGLLAGLGGTPQTTDSVSNGSFTLTELSRPRSPPTVPVRQPVARNIGLRAAREGIFKSIYDLLKLREEERNILSFRVDERADALGEIDKFSTKKAGLKNAIASIHNNEGNQRSKELQDESHHLETEIRELETKLLEMKVRHRHVIQELSQMENAVESKMSSYKASLSLVESDIDKFLRQPSVQPHLAGSNQSTFYSLNPKRRTLEMARDHWQMEQVDLRKRQQEIDAEIQALEEGGGIWKQVIGEVSSFEKRLRATMRRSIQTSQILKADKQSRDSLETDQIRTVIEDLDQMTNSVEQHLDLAERKGWKLLTCCIGAELGALREAREMLLDAFGVSEEALWPGRGKKKANEDHPDRHHDSFADPLSVDNPEPPADLLRDETHSHTAAARSEDEDDEPDPAWLLPEV
ncbi:uncharacterized protein ACLA_047830 [Aspergillus clavatus NRRL 1]|uniref:Autophagy-related protein Atg28 n=1 Tax=Aspergillus clavatus (strain ATCC 1007 / CBS 513.65 / DSM 816 / NCTC 3887 / NRRL 1 / QM 1276 / 107) TaxID=344612 RepID=A1CHF9_ASPCL|nr:uncharacterized protein ACLA_047830 [Aspergillus clavatus NRRL 1]EAW10314.1 conserved hypothetical protein [Aspergillus clavatus NRRL 1]